MQGCPICNSRVRLSWGRSQNNSGPTGHPLQARTSPACLSQHGLATYRSHHQLPSSGHRSQKTSLKPKKPQYRYTTTTNNTMPYIKREETDTTQNTASKTTQIVEFREGETRELYDKDREARTLIFVERQAGAENLLSILLKKGHWGLAAGAALEDDRSAHQVMDNESVWYGLTGFQESVRRLRFRCGQQLEDGCTADHGQCGRGRGSGGGRYCLRSELSGTSAVRRQIVALTSDDYRRKCAVDTHNLISSPIPSSAARTASPVQAAQTTAPP
ncbi:uncharacterized protein K452DRAFT_345447 [Aplosporella prunicola CBS 121167]|uniref:Uncharacterized protein n=1 Tax=Aplosporella prunicola CBS 121167 TaxID=1176127 RepID=A0A6A6BK51_9PEZI|nr:uncharacterized protein K452DRAFT_345447 [Aplosporella prunicola CBS 121167]KAF2144018.1 hypothetical protein K452DRAFT_345447 [Aplosporella prunicola CBS 121167]